jgi:hypothetical protein
MYVVIPKDHLCYVVIFFAMPRYHLELLSMLFCYSIHFLIQFYIVQTYCLGY